MKLPTAKRPMEQVRTITYDADQLTKYLHAYAKSKTPKGFRLSTEGLVRGFDGLAYRILYISKGKIPNQEVRISYQEILDLFKESLETAGFSMQSASVVNEHKMWPDIAFVVKPH
jgi:hypothetical protein